MATPDYNSCCKGCVHLKFAYTAQVGSLLEGGPEDFYECSKGWDTNKAWNRYADIVCDDMQGENDRPWTDAEIAALEAHNEEVHQRNLEVERLEELEVERLEAQQG